MNLHHLHRKPYGKPTEMYVIRAAESGRLKIGRSTDILRRLPGLQCGSPEVLQAIYTLPAMTCDEVQVHRCLAPHRLHGEWYLPEAPWQQAVRTVVRPKKPVVAWPEDRWFSTATLGVASL